MIIKFIAAFGIIVLGALVLGILDCIVLGLLGKD